MRRFWNAIQMLGVIVLLMFFLAMCSFHAMIRTCAEQDIPRGYCAEKWL